MSDTKVYMIDENDGETCLFEIDKDTGELDFEHPRLPTRISFNVDEQRKILKLILLNLVKL